MLMHDTTQRVCEHPHGRREIFSRWAYGEKRKVRSVPRPRREQTEPEAREGFLGEKPSDTMFEAFYKTAMSVRAPSRAPDPKPCLDGPRAAPTTKYTRAPSTESDRDRLVPRLHSFAQRSSVYVAVVIAGALVGEKVRPPPGAPIGTSPPVDAPRSSPAGQPGESDRTEKPSLADSRPPVASPTPRPSPAGREQRFRRHVGVAQQGEAVQGHDHPRARGVRKRSCREAGTVHPPPAPSAERRAFCKRTRRRFSRATFSPYITSRLVKRNDAVWDPTSALPYRITLVSNACLPNPGEPPPFFLR